MTKNVMFDGKLSTFSKYVISPKLINILKFGFDHTKSPESYYEKQLSLKFFKNFFKIFLKFFDLKFCISKWSR